MTKTAAPTPPRRLSNEARKLWQQILDDYRIDDQAGLLLLETALEALDRMRQAQALIAKHGLLIADRFGQLRANPASIAERDARSAMLHALKALNLDLEPLREVMGRPPGSAKARREKGV